MGTELLLECSYFLQRDKESGKQKQKNTNVTAAAIVQMTDLTT